MKENEYFVAYEISHLLEERGLFNKEALDLEWKECKRMATEFLFSEYNDPKKAQLDCIKEYLGESAYWEVSIDKLEGYVEGWSNQYSDRNGPRWLAKCGDKYIAMDDGEACCWVEEFWNHKTAVDWLEGKCDADGLYFAGYEEEEDGDL